MVPALSENHVMYQSVFVLYIFVIYYMCLSLIRVLISSKLNSFGLNV